MDLVLLHYALPDIDGGIVAEAMKEHKPNVPIILVSGGDIRANSLALFNHRVRKGDPEVLLTAIRGLMASSVRFGAGQPMPSI